MTSEDFIQQVKGVLLDGEDSLTEMTSIVAMGFLVFPFCIAAVSGFHVSDDSRSVFVFGSLVTLSVIMGFFWSKVRLRKKLNELSSEIGVLLYLYMRDERTFSIVREEMRKKVEDLMPPSCGCGEGKRKNQIRRLELLFECLCRRENRF